LPDQPTGGFWKRALHGNRQGGYGDAKQASRVPTAVSKKLSTGMTTPSISVDISVVIVAWNAKPYVELCLESLTKAPPRRNMEVFVVDNASEDGTSEMIEAKFPWVKLIKSFENLGFSRGNNVAIRQCQGRYIALVNPDVIVFPGCLDALADFLDQNPKVGNVGPKVLNPDMSMQSTCRRFPSLWNNFCSFVRQPVCLLGSRTRDFSRENTCSTSRMIGHWPWMSLLAVSP
jgi:glycosyltransferase involved in cell wall biosynthesis